MKQNDTIDLAKYIASLLVVAIHVSLLSDLNSIAYFFIVKIICQMAVPFFSMCTGYFLGIKLDRIEIYDGKNNGYNIFIAQWKKFIFLYIVWSVIYLFYSIPLWIEIRWLSLNAFVDFGVATILFGSHYHFWYLLSVIYAMPLFYLCVKYLKTKIHIIVIVLWIVKAISYGYSIWIPIQFIMWPLDNFPGMRDALFCILPMMLTGYYSNYTKSKGKQHYLIKFSVCFLFLCIEALILVNLGQDSVSNILFTLPTSYSLFNLILKQKIQINIFNGKMLRYISLFIYCIHPIIIEITDKVINNSVIQYIVCVSVSTLIGIMYANIKQLLAFKRIES